MKIAGLTGPRRASAAASFVAIVAGVAWTSAQTPPPAQPQQPPAAFRAGARTVPVYVTVHDRAGGFVLNLSRDDFEVKDNGKIQEITQFATDAQALSALILIDGSSSMLPVFNTVLEAASGFVMRMLPADRTAIASFADIFQMRQPFSGNRDELLAHMRDEFNIRVGSETRLWDSLAEGVLALSKESGRRVVLVLTDGRNWTASQRPTLRGPNQILSLALDYDVMIYAIAMWTKWEGAQERPSGEISTLARETGGGFVELRESDDVGATLTQIAAELHQQYVLGFTPQVLDGKKHKLDVRVKRPNLAARARASYLAPTAAGGR